MKRITISALEPVIRTHSPSLYTQAYHIDIYNGIVLPIGILAEFCILMGIRPDLTLKSLMELK